MAPTRASPPLDPRGLAAAASLSSALRTERGGDTGVSRGGRSQSLTTAVADVAVTKLSSAGVRKEQAGRAARARSLTITDVKGKLANHARSTPSSHISKEAD